MSPTIIGFLVAAMSFLVLQFIVLRHFRSFTLPALLFAVGGGLMLAIAFGEPGATLYQLGWMLGMSLCVAIGFIAGMVKRDRPRR